MIGIQDKTYSADNGGLRDDNGKTEFHLLPLDGITELGKVYTFGAKKYAPRNWERGMLWSRCYNSLLRHLYAYWGGERSDQETGLHHMAHVAWNAIALLVYSLRGVGVDDRCEKKTVDALCELQNIEASESPAQFFNRILEEAGPKMGKDAHKLFHPDGREETMKNLENLIERTMPAPIHQAIELKKGTKLRLRHTGENQVWTIISDGCNADGKFQVRCDMIKVDQWVHIRAVEEVLGEA